MGRALSSRMKKTLIYSLLVAGTLGLGGSAYADHDKECKNVHGKVTVVTDEGISVNDKLYKVGSTTRITKGDKKVKLTQITAGDLVCLDVRGKDDIGGGEVAAVSVLSLKDSPVERQYVREKETVRKIGHDKTCNHVHGKVTRIEDSAIMIDGKLYPVRETTKYVKGDQIVTIKTIKTGDFLCLNAGENGDVEQRVTTVMVLDPEAAAQFQPREVIREREQIREKIREQK